MFDSKKWLILFFVLALFGSIGGSLVAYLILNGKKKEAALPPIVAKADVSAAPVASTTASVPAKNKPADMRPATSAPVALIVTNVAPAVDETARPDFPIMTRAEWKAHAPVLEMKPHHPSLITIHHTATAAAPTKDIASKLRGLQDFSQHEGTLSSGKTKPAWPDMPYHFYIDANGKVAEGRDINYVGDSNTDYDATGHILIALEGNFENAEPTKQQMDVLFKMVTWLSKKYKVPADKISSHKAYASTACPGRNLESRLDEIRQYAWKN